MNDKVKGIFDRLEQGIKGVFESDKYREYLIHMSKFHSYSARNSLLILMQRPDASYVAGYNSWIKDHKRHVMPGEKGIQILGFTPYKRSYLQDKKDDQGQPIFDRNGKPEQEEVVKKVAAFKPVYVYDISQTDGEPMPELTTELQGSVKSYDDMMETLKNLSPFPIQFEEMSGSKKGYCNYAEEKIAIKSGMSEQAIIKTAIHEITHAIAHTPQQDENGKEILKDRQTEEIEAESTAFVVCEHFGIDTSDYSFPYLAAWSGSKELTVLQNSLDAIQANASNLIKEIESNLSSLQKSKDHDILTEQKPIASETVALNHANTNTQDSPELFAEDFARTMQNFYKEHPNYLESTQLANTSPSFIIHQIEVGHIFASIEGGLRQLASHSEYKEQANSFRQRLDNFIGTQNKPNIEQASSQPDQSELYTRASYYSINEEAARRAKQANGFSEYIPGSATAEYKNMVYKAVEIASNQKDRVDPMYHEKIDQLLDSYARKLAENMNNRNSIDGRVPSMMIAGGSNFPVRKKEKQNAARDKNMREWQDIQGFLDKIRSTGMGGISADDHNAIPKLKEKLAGLEKSQDTMKKANAYYRKHKTLDGCPVLSEEVINKLTTDMKIRWYGREARQPFEAYALQNNSSEIRRVKARIEELTNRKEAVLIGWQFDGGKVEVNKQDNRLQVFFDTKPDADARSELKSNGFRWAPSVSAWQRQLNANAFYAANNIKCIQPLTGEKPTDLQRNTKNAETQIQGDPTFQEPQSINSFAIYQLIDNDSTRYLRFEPYDRLQAAGHSVDPSNYSSVYTDQLDASDTLDAIYMRFNTDHPSNFTGHSLSVSDVIVLIKDHTKTAFYIDSHGFKEIPEFLSPSPAIDTQKTAAMATEPDSFLTGDKVKTPRGQFSLTDMTTEQMTAAGYSFHHSSDDGNYHIMGNGTRAFAIINPLRISETSIEQNINMIEDIPNNAPSVDELETKAKAGEQINLSDLSAAIKADKEANRRMNEIHDSVKFDNDIDLDKEKNRSQLGFNDADRPKVSMNDRFSAAKEKSQQRNSQNIIDNEKEKSECLQ